MPGDRIDVDRTGARAIALYICERRSVNATSPRTIRRKIFMPQPDLSAVRRVGVISDTHGLLRPHALAALAGVELILHAGDIGAPAVIAGLEALPPVIAVRGNNDVESWAHAIPETRDVMLRGMRVHLLHDLHSLARDVAAHADMVIAGHSHRPLVERRGAKVHLNPGSAGPRRFRLPVSVALLEYDGSAFAPRIVELPI